MGLLEQFRLSSNVDFVGIVHQAVLASAVDIRNEDPATPAHDIRVAFSDHVLMMAADSAQPYILAFVRIAASNPTIEQSAVTDGVVHPENVEDNDVLYVVATNWNVIAGETVAPV